MKVMWRKESFCGPLSPSELVHGPPGVDHRATMHRRAECRSRLLHLGTMWKRKMWKIEKDFHFSEFLHFLLFASQRIATMTSRSLPLQKHLNRCNPELRQLQKLNSVCGGVRPTTSISIACIVACGLNKSIGMNKYVLNVSNFCGIEVAVFLFIRQSRIWAISIMGYTMVSILAGAGRAVMVSQTVSTKIELPPNESTPKAKKWIGYYSYFFRSQIVQELFDSYRLNPCVFLLYSYIF